MRCHASPGSSPRVRGTGARQALFRTQERFIPACAGNGNSRFRVTNATSVHPRVCGERHGLAVLERVGYGSSPRVRGTGHPRDRGGPNLRFIPACAGNGTALRAMSCRTSVHPRVCGERISGSRASSSSAGSSPRVRGTASNVPLRERIPRFIPACAGNGCAPIGCSSVPAVHPRVCGERTLVWQIAEQDNGSSPRVRGTVRMRLRRRRDERFIPACAGNGRQAGVSAAP